MAKELDDAVGVAVQKGVERKNSGVAHALLEGGIDRHLHEARGDGHAEHALLRCESGVVIIEKALGAGAAADHVAEETQRGGLHLDTPPRLRVRRVHVHLVFERHDDRGGDVVERDAADRNEVAAVGELRLDLGELGDAAAPELTHHVVTPRRRHVVGVVPHQVRNDALGARDDEPVVTVLGATARVGSYDLLELAAAAREHEELAGHLIPRDDVGKDAEAIVHHRVAVPHPFLLHDSPKVIKTLIESAVILNLNVAAGEREEEDEKEVPHLLLAIFQYPHQLHHPSVALEDHAAHALRSRRGERR